MSASTFVTPPFRRNASKRRAVVVGVAVAAFLAAIVVPSSPAAAATFRDVPQSHTFHRDIDWIAANGVTKGCSSDSYCPDRPVTRGEMAAFLSRGLKLTATSNTRFRDVSTSHTFHRDIDRIATASITRGCSSDSYCPDRPVTRGEMAAFLSRGLKLTATSNTRFRDVSTSHTFHRDIDRIATASITRGCSSDSYCPDRPVTRGELAAFFRRGLEATPPQPSARKASPPAQTPAPEPTSPPAQPAEESIGTSGALPLGSADYPAPSNAIYVAPNGNNSAAGTAQAPLATVAAAISRASAGATIVLRGGTYHQTFTVSKQVTIQNHPGEAVWFDGSRAITSWQSSGGRWVHNGWEVEFDASPTFTWGAPDNEAAGWGFVNANYPMAAHPDQVWIDGTAQRQVGSRNEVVAGTFFVDTANQQLVIGTNPSGRDVRASALARAIEVRAEGSVLRGFGVRRYAPSVPHMGTITAERNGVVVENLHVTDNATTGISFLAANQRASRLTILRNGMLGIHGNNSDRLVADNLLVRENNTERFNTSPTAGGMKITRARGVTVTDSEFGSNHGTGFWLDEEVYDGVIANSVLSDNAGHGMSLELSAKMLVANNLIRDNIRFGIKVNNTSDVAVWNNTILRNDRPVNIVQDSREPTSVDTPGRDRRQPFPDPTMTWINGPVTVNNNVISVTRGNCLICVEDYSGRFSAEVMGVTTNGNIYHRTSSSSPQWFAVWSRGSGNPAVHNTFGAFRSATGQDARSHAFDGGSIVDGSGRLLHGTINDPTAVAIELPESVANRIGQSSGTRHVGAFFGP